MSFMCPVVGTHKYLDYIGEYTDKEKSEYTEMGKRIIANASANEVMIMEYYKHTDENVPIIRGGIRGGEVKIIDVPVFPGYIPLRAAFENLDYDVTWDNETHTVYVSTPEIEAE